MLDYERITRTERYRAKQFWSSSSFEMEEEEEDEAGKTQDQIINNKSNTFTPGEGASAEESFVVNFTKEEKEQIRQMVANANSSQEIEEIERSVKKGIFPRQTAFVASTTNGNTNNRKRPVPEDNSATTRTTTAITSKTESGKKQKTDA
jgi:hypothetical protein